jgi:hypothetical protein
MRVLDLDFYGEQPLRKDLPLFVLAVDQGDQIRRIFDFWEINYFLALL